MYEAKTLPVHCLQQRNHKTDVDKCAYIDSFMKLSHNSIFKKQAGV